MKKINILISIFFISGTLFTSCKDKPEAPPAAPSKVCISDSMSHLIKLDTATISNISSQLSLSGEVSFDENKVVKVFPFSGGQVLEVKVSLGDRVTKGQTLAVIRSADVAGNYSDLRSSSADVAIAKRELDNAKSLYEKGISSEREYTLAKENYEKAIIASKKVNDQIQINGGGHTNANGNYIVTAPASGFIVEKNTTAGSYIRTDNSNSLFTISDLSHVWVLANVFEADISKVKLGDNASITTLAYPGKTFNAKIDKISEVLDPLNKVMHIRMTLPNEGFMLKPEMFTTVLIANQLAEKTVTIPSEAVIFDNSKKFVVVYHGNCDLEIREVEIRKTVSNITYLKSGLQANDVVISQNQILLYRALTEQ